MIGSKQRIHDRDRRGGASSFPAFVGESDSIFREVRRGRVEVDCQIPAIDVNVALTPDLPNDHVELVDVVVPNLVLPFIKHRG